ncbi:MAG: DUF5110 domain-containing protein [Anaerolineae bacterium]|nr:DUF5110 domain-containing protein [Anaerolineae bacterium]
MSAILEPFKLEFMPLAASDAVVQVGHARFMVLTERLIRLEYHPQDCFEDRASQAFWYRHQPVPDFNVQLTENSLEIETAYLHLQYSGGDFSPENLSIRLKGSGTVWRPGDVDEQNLRGTTRTLDFVNGYTPLQPGLMSRAGWSVLDDSATLVFNAESWLEPREAGGIDWYFFGYGHDYKACLQDYCRVSGKIPMIPRWVLGNWWSRYWHYSQDDLKALLEDFESHQLPFSVCIVDMDWHITKTNNDSTGWTGYTWNRELFPDPEGLIEFVHQKNLRVSLNLHPAEGIHDHEEQYPEMAQRVGIDPKTRQPVLFDITNPVFAKAYFEVLHHPYEKMGVDFWWVDWQQGLKSRIPGLDPLWLINHLHFYDLGRDGVRRPFIFSRWGNEGHQRYPIGFSGDSYTTWDSLRFQSYMTATSTNIAYGWWSHDIGGHTSGMEDPELFTRWVQLGVFSPINRIHVTKGLFYDRRPWAFEDAEVLRVLREAMQLRHAFLPYLYTMAWRGHRDSLPLIEPMYYDYPEAEAAYNCPQQYLFGTELIAAPFVNPADPETGLSRQVVWLPKGDWYNFFTGEHFTGDCWHSVYGTLGDIPLFAKAGAIVPLAGQAERNGADNPDELNIHIFAGADGAFTLYEDDGETTAYLNRDSCETTFSQTWRENRLEFMIDAPKGYGAFIPQKRAFSLYIHGVRESAVVMAQVNGSKIAVTTHYDAPIETLHISGIQLDNRSSLVVSVQGENLLSRRDRKAETILRLLKFFKLHTGVRNRLAENLEAILTDPAKIAPYVIAMSEAQARALFEVLYEAGLHYVGDTHHPTLVVMWNNKADENITYRYGDAYLYFGSVQSANHTNGVVPRFTTFVPPVRNWSHGAEGEHVHRTQWYAQVDYHNLLTVIEQCREISP